MDKPTTESPAKPTRGPKASGEPDSIIRKAKWASLKEEFIDLSLKGAAIHWPTLALKYGFEVNTVRNKASINKWYAEIENRRKMREEVLETKLTERTAMALDELNRDFATNEAAIRSRHATMARGLQGRAITRLKEIPLSDFSPRDALAMLKLGIDEERFALGLSQTFEGGDISQVNTQYQPIVEQIGGHQKVQKIGMLLLAALKDTPIDTDEADLAASGLGPSDVLPKAPTYKPVPPATVPTVASAINSTKKGAS